MVFRYSSELVPASRHGAGSSSVLWMDLVRRLSPRRRVLAPDLPGHGQSDPWHPTPEKDPRNKSGAEQVASPWRDHPTSERPELSGE